MISPADGATAIERVFKAVQPVEGLHRESACSTSVTAAAANAGEQDRRSTDEGGRLLDEIDSHAIDDTDYWLTVERKLDFDWDDDPGLQF